MPEKEVPQSLITRIELVDLHRQYEEVVRNEFEFYFKYQNFYITLFTTLIGLTITGTLAFNSKHSFLLLLILIGPILIIFISLIAIKNIECYYRRAMEAIITVTNLNAMLGYCHEPHLEKGLNMPTYFSKTGGFLTQYNTKEIQDILNEAKKDSDTDKKTSECMLEEFVAKGDIFKFSKHLFLMFQIAAFVLIVITTAYFIFEYFL